MSKEKRPKIPYEFFDVDAGNSMIRLHYFDGSQYAARKQCDENPSLVAVKIEYMHGDGRDKNNSCFFAVGERNTLLSACLRQNTTLNASRERHVVEFIDCAQSTHEVILEGTDRRACPVHFYLDLEIKSREFGNTVIPPNIDIKLTPAIIRIVLDILKNWITQFDYSMEENVIILTSTRPEQYSIHITFKNIVFPSVSVVHAFAREMKSKTDAMSPFNLYSSRIIDFGVYKKETTLRMMHFGKSLMKSQWNPVARAPRVGVKTHALRLLEVCDFPPNVASVLDQVIYASISMDTTSLGKVNAFPKIPLDDRTPVKRSTYTEKRAKHANQTLELDSEGKDVLDKMYARLEDMVYWPRSMLNKAFKNMVTNDSIVLDSPLEPIYVFEYVDHEDGAPCFRDPALFQPRSIDQNNGALPFDRHHKSPVSLYVYANGNVKQSCWVHHEGYKLFFLGNYLNQVEFKLGDSVDICEKREVDALGINILNLMG